MAILTYPQIITFTFTNGLNISVTVGDYACYSAVTPVGGFVLNTPGTNVTYFGNVISINQDDPDSIEVQVLFNGLHDDVVNTNNDASWTPGDVPNEYLITLPTSSDFILFVKNDKVNTSSLVGYYAELEFRNYSKAQVELFSVGSETVQSSK